MVKIDRTQFAAAHHQGMHRDDLAEHFGITPTAVTRIRHELGLPLDRKRPAVRHRPRVITADAFAAADDGKRTIAELAAHFKVSTTTISRMRHRAGATPATIRPMTPERRAKIEAMLDDGWSFAEITRTEGAYPATLRRHFPGRQWTREQRAAHISALRITREDWNAPHYQKPLAA